MIRDDEATHFLRLVRVYDLADRVDDAIVQRGVNRRRHLAVPATDHEPRARPDQVFQ